MRGLLVLVLVHIIALITGLVSWGRVGESACLGVVLVGCLAAARTQVYRVVGLGVGTNVDTLAVRRSIGTLVLLAFNAYAMLVLWRLDVFSSPHAFAMVMGMATVTHGFIVALGDVVTLRQWLRVTEGAEHKPPVVTVFAPGNHRTGLQAMQWVADPALIRAVTLPTRREWLLDGLRLLFLARSPPLLDAYWGRVLTVEAAPARVRDLGGCHDANAFVKGFLGALAHEANKKTRFLLTGYGRGAATVFNAVGLLAAREDWATHLRPRIAGVLCIGGPFARADDVFEQRFLHWMPLGLRARLEPMLRRWFDGWFAGYAETRRLKFHPVDRVAHFARAKLPLWIIASRADTQVPAEAIEPLVAGCIEARIRSETVWLKDADHDLRNLSTPDAKLLLAFMERVHASARQ